jgi:hypothetical protein
MASASDISSDSLDVGRGRGEGGEKIQAPTESRGGMSWEINTEDVRGEAGKVKGMDDEEESTSMVSESSGAYLSNMAEILASPSRRGGEGELNGAGKFDIHNMRVLGSVNSAGSVGRGGSPSAADTSAFDLGGVEGGR